MVYIFAVSVDREYVFFGMSNKMYKDIERERLGMIKYWSYSNNILQGSHILINYVRENIPEEEYTKRVSVSVFPINYPTKSYTELVKNRTARYYSDMGMPILNEDY